MSRLTCIALLLGLFKKFWLWICVSISLITARLKWCNLFKESLQSLTDKERLLCSYHIQCLYSLHLPSDHTGNVISLWRNAVCSTHSFLVCIGPASGSLYFWKILHLLIYSLHEIPKVKMQSLSFSQFCFFSDVLYLPFLQNGLQVLYKVRGFLQSEEERRRGMEALLLVLTMFCWEQCKPLVCDYSFPPREQALLPCPTAALIIGWEYCNTQSTAVSGLEIQLFVWDPAVSPPPSLPHSWLLFFFVLFVFHFISNWETCHILSGWKGDPLKIFASCLVDGKTS